MLFCWEIAQLLIDRKVKQMDKQVQRGEKVEGMYLTYLLSSNKLSLAEVYITITELLLGGVDTVRVCVGVYGGAECGGVCVCVCVRLSSTAKILSWRDFNWPKTSHYMWPASQYGANDGGSSTVNLHRGAPAVLTKFRTLLSLARPAN